MRHRPHEPRGCSHVDPATRKATTNPKRGGTLYAHIADIRMAWRYSRHGLRLPVAQAVLLSYGLGWHQREIAKLLGVSQQAVSGYLVEGVGRLMAYLNGDSYCEGWAGEE